MDCLDQVYGNTKLKANLHFKSEPKLPCCCFLLYVAVLPYEITIRLCQTVSCVMPRLTEQEFQK